MSVWSKASKCAVLAPGEPALLIEWEAEGCWARAHVADAPGGLLRVLSFEVSAPGDSSIPGYMRRLPSDAQVTEAVLRHPDGPLFIVWLRDELSEVSGDQGFTEDMDSSDIENMLRDHLARSTSRMRAARRRPPQIEQEVQWLTDQLRKAPMTSELVARFMREFPCATATAYRRLRMARDRLEARQ